VLSYASIKGINFCFHFFPSLVLLYNLFVLRAWNVSKQITASSIVDLLLIPAQSYQHLISRRHMKVPIRVATSWLFWGAGKMILTCCCT